MRIISSLLSPFFSPPNEDFIGMASVFYRGDDPCDFCAYQQALAIALKAEADFLESLNGSNLEDDERAEDEHEVFAGFPIC